MNTHRNPLGKGSAFVDFFMRMKLCQFKREDVYTTVPSKTAEALFSDMEDCSNTIERSFYYN